MRIGQPSAKKILEIAPDDDGAGQLEGSARMSEFGTTLLATRMALDCGCDTDGLGIA